ncbi:MAG: hypothetical protein KKF68_01875 [Nanoarchaeota archaeon]|nr:hypothetical protein [Nanoarchaeota archaeon]
MSEKEKDSMEEIPKNVANTELEIRKEKLIDFLKKKKDWVFYIILSFILFINVYIRTRNISKLKDITTGTWTLGPDLDPFLFLRWAEYIVEHGSLMTQDMMRYVPLGYNTAAEMKLLSYMIAWFYHVVSFFSREMTVTYAAILFPVAMSILTAIAFFLFARKIFYKETSIIKNITALLATGFFILIPSLLPRTIAGIPEKESAGFFFIFVAFYLFLEACTAKTIKKSVIFGSLAGISTGLLALIWGGVTFVFMTIAGTVLFSFLLGKVNKQIFYGFVAWVPSFIIMMVPFSTRYDFSTIIASTSTGLVFMMLFILLIDFALFRKNVFNIKNKIKIKIPEQVISFIISIILLSVLASIFFGISFIPDKINGIIDQTVHPLSQSRFGITVAENRQPYFISEWRGNFGPIVFNIPLYFWLFFLGSIYLFKNMIEKLSKKERIILTFSYFIFLVCLIFSRYSPESVLDGDTPISLLIYFSGFLFFSGCFGYFYFKRYLEGNFSVFKKFNFAYILYFIIFTMSIIGARGAIRLIMVLGAISPIAISFICVKISQKYFQEKEETIKFFIGISAIIIIIATIFTLWNYYEQDRITAENFAPGYYQWQWQKAMSWVRENTPTNSVFAHWWDYGYWLQSIGERATILDGGNNIGYWNHLMGRYVLTGDDEKLALEFLYAHNGTHVLIDSTEIGKYTAYSSIGSDKDYDRFSWISTFLINDKQTQETKNETIYVYTGGTLLDEDLLWNKEGREIFLPKRRAGIGGILVKLSSEGELSQPEAIFVYNNQQYNIPLRYAYFKGNLHDFNTGLDAGIFLFPKLDTLSTGGMNLNEIGALMYLSKRTIHSQLANLYLFNQESNYFKIVHVEDSAVVENLKFQGANIGDFIYYQGFQGPIKIWEVEYPSNIEYNPEYIDTHYPQELNIITSGEYN